MDDDDEQRFAGGNRGTLQKMSTCTRCRRNPCTCYVKYSVHATDDDDDQRFARQQPWCPPDVDLRQMQTESLRLL